MRNKLSIKFKAVFLLIVFSLNTVVGFACAIGVDMGFNASHHHHDEEAIEVMSEVMEHHHHELASGHQEDNRDNSKEDDCCNKKVLQISQEDKALPQTHSLISAIFFSAYIASYPHSAIFYSSQVTAMVKYFVRCYHPPIPDIRIAIRSFQI